MKKLILALLFILCLIGWCATVFASGSAKANTGFTWTFSVTPAGFSYECVGLNE